MPRIEASQGVALHYDDTGRGPPIVLVHGWAMSSRSLVTLAEALAPAHRVVSVDLRGHGLSSPRDRYGLEDLAGDVEAVFEALRLRDVILLGWSLGAQVALAAARRLPTRVAGLCLLSGTPRFLADGAYPHGLSAEEVESLSARLARNPAKALRRFAAAMIADGEAPPEARDAIAAALLCHPPHLEAALRGLDTLAAADLRATLGDVGHRVLLIHGERDAICPPGASAYMAERIPDATLVVLGGAGHAPFVARATELADRIRLFARDA